MSDYQTYQRLSLMRMSIAAIRRQMNEQLDAMDAELAAMIPEDQFRKRSYTIDEMRSQIAAVLHKPNTTVKNRKPHAQ